MAELNQQQEGALFLPVEPVILVQSEGALPVRSDLGQLGADAEGPAQQNLWQDPIPLEASRSHFHLPTIEAAKAMPALPALGLSQSGLNQACRSFKTSHWPSRMVSLGGVADRTVSLGGVRSHLCLHID
jgi:hypothetical protein